MEDKTKSIFNQTAKVVKKAVQVGVLGTALATGTVIPAGCKMPSNYDNNSEIVDISKEQTQDVEPHQPYNKVIGNKNYCFHNFIGQEPDIVDYTANKDVANYLDMGQEYVQGLFDKFQTSIQDRPDVANYFGRFELQKTNRHERGVGKKIDNLANEITAPCGYYLADIIKNLDREVDREAFILCYATLANEAYREGLGNSEKYDARRGSIEHAWRQNDFTRSTEYNHDIDDRKCRQTTNDMDILLDCAWRNMQYELDDLRIQDLRNVVIIALNTSSLEAMHDYTAENLEHTRCDMQIDILDQLYAASQAKQQQQENYRNLER